MALPRADLMTVREVAQMMRVSNMTVYRMIKGGELGAVRIGKNYRIRKNDVLAYLMRRSVRIGDAAVGNFGTGTAASAVSSAGTSQDGF
jgi:excisionase family DNA binding protein